MSMGLDTKGALNPGFTDADARDALFVEMLRGFRRSGGLAREADVLDWAKAHQAPSWRDASEAIICFEWDQQLWLPWFQFDLTDMSLRPGPASVIAELATAFDGWEMATWFAQPNVWIGGARPIDIVDQDLYSVLGAARADRFIAAG